MFHDGTCNRRFGSFDPFDIEGYRMHKKETYPSFLDS